MFGILVFLFTVIPAVEIYLLFKIGGEIGGLNTFMVVIFTGILGASLAKSQGLSILMKIQEKTNKGGLPGDQIIQGLMVFAGGLLLLTPGFATDIFGFSLVLPGTRHLLLVWVRRMVVNAIKSGKFQFQSFGAQHGGRSYSYSNASTASFDQEENNSSATVDGNIIDAEFTVKK